jgi:hypothetical protein
MKKLNSQIQTEGRNGWSHLLALSVVFLITALMTKVLQDVIIGERSYGHGRYLYPLVVGILTALLHFRFGELTHSIWRVALLGFLTALFAGIVASFIDAAVNQDFWFALTKSSNGWIHFVLGNLLQPVLLMTPLSGALAFLVARRMSVLSN